MTTLRIHALGRLCVFCDQTPLEFPTQKTQDLLCFLLLHAGETLEREWIAEQLWPMRTPGKARRCLSTTLWRLRQTLEDHPSLAGTYLLAERDRLAFCMAAPYWFDAESFERQATFGLTGPLPCTEVHHQALEEALDLYQGDLLEGCYDDWCLAERERLQLLLLRVLKRLQRHCRLCKDFEVAISYGHRLLALDPLQEDAHRDLMRCYADAGKRPIALEHFRRCRQMLRQELQIEPMPETWQLYRQIRGDQSVVPSPGKGEGDRSSLQVALAQFRHALDGVESAWQALQAAASELVGARESTPCGATYPELE